MKRYFLYLLTAVLGILNIQPASAQQTQDALYIFRNDGGFNGFFYNDINHISYSKVDTLGVEHDDYVVQEVYALDSIYRIPISAIDSVCFITPETIYQEDVIPTSSTMWDYVIGSSDPLTTFTLSATTPAGLVPKVGDKLANTEVTTHLPYGFYGQVTSVDNTDNGIVVVIKHVPMEELFKQHIIKVAAETEDWSTTESTRSSKSRRVPQTLIPLDLPPEIIYTAGLGDLALMYPGDGFIFSGTGNTTMSIKPSVRVRAFASIGWVTGSVYDAAFRIETKTDFKFNASGTLMIRKDLPLAKLGPVPIGTSGFFFDLEAGLTISYSGKIDVNFHSYDHSSVSSSLLLKEDKYAWVEETDMFDGMVAVESKTYDSSSDFAVKSKGTLQAGIYMTPSISLLKIVSLKTRIEEGSRICSTAEIDGNIDYTIPEELSGSITSSVYEMFNHDGAFTSNFYLSGTAIGAVTGTKWKVSKPFFNEPVDQGFSGAMVPKFSNLSYVAGEDGSYTFSADLSRRVPLYYPVGFALYDSTDHLVATKWSDFNYDGTQKKYSLTFEGLQQGAYKFYPTCKLYGYGILASPRLLFNTRSNDNLEVTPNELVFSNQGGSKDFVIKTTNEIQDVNISIEYEDGESGWLSYSLKNSNPIEKEYTVNVTKNENEHIRSAFINILVMMQDGTQLQEDIHVLQDHTDYPPVLELPTDTIYLDQVGTATTILVETNTEDISINRNASWLITSYDKNTKTLTIEAIKNDEEYSRTGIITVTATNKKGTVEEEIVVIQDGAGILAPLKITRFEFYANCFKDGFRGIYESYKDEEFQPLSFMVHPDNDSIIYIPTFKKTVNDHWDHWGTTALWGYTNLEFTASIIRTNMIDTATNKPYYAFPITGHVKMTGSYCDYDNNYERVDLECEFDYSISSSGMAYGQLWGTIHCDRDVKITNFNGTKTTEGGNTTPISFDGLVGAEFDYQVDEGEE